MRVVLQTEAAECGLACLCMIADSFGMQISLQEVRRQVGASLKGQTLQQLLKSAAELQLVGRAVTLELDEIIALELPCILHWDLKHFVVLTKCSSRSFEIHDPARGAYKVTRGEFSKHFTGVAIEFSAGAEFRPRKALPKLRVTQLTGRVRGLWRALAQVFAIALVLQLLALLAPLLNQLIVDDVLSTGDRDLLTALIAGFAILLIVQTSLTVIRAWMVMLLGNSISLQWFTNVFAHLVRLPIEWFERRHVGDIASRFASVNSIQRTVTTGLVEALLDGMMATTALVVMALYSWQLTLVVCCAVLLYALLRVVSYRPLRDATAERLVLGAREHSHFLETLRAITPLRLFGREDDRRQRWHNLMVDVQNRDTRTAKLNILHSTANAAIFGIENLLVFWLAARMIMESQATGPATFTVGMLFAFVSYKNQFAGRVTSLINYAFELRMLGLQVERLSDIVLAAPVPAARKAMDHMTTVAKADVPSIELRDVGYRYSSSDPWVLRHVSFVIQPKEFVLIVGVSGSGKTTLAKLLLGLLQPTEGEILFGGVPVSQTGWQTLRSRIIAVMQDDHLLSGSLAENVSFFDTESSPERIEQAAKLAAVHDEIDKMPMAYQTLVGHMSAGLSGGQRQRVLLARALYRAPAVVLLDEATSNLDLDNERKIAKTMGSLGLTRIVVSHRPELVPFANRVLSVGAGKVMELTVSAGPTTADPDSMRPIGA